MRKLLLFTLLLVLGISFCSNIFAQVTVTLGEGTQSNSTSGTPTPYGTYYMNFRQQYLVLASDLNDIGGGPGNINSVAFNVDNVNTCSPMPNFRIRVKATEQTALSSTFEVGDYTEVFQVAEYMPVNGWNTHTFSAPFNWDGASNLLIDVVTDLIPGGYTQNASVFYTATTFNSTLRAQSDTAPAIDAPTGTATMNRANMQFNMEALDIVDLNALSIEGPTAPSVNSSVDYAVSVKNYSLSAISTYTVKLMQEGGIELASVPGTIIEPQQTLEFTLPWTPAVVGETHLYGKVVMAGDENPANDETNMLTVTVMEEGLQVVEIGDGTEVNTTIGMPTTYGTYYKNFRQQFLVLATELNDLGGGPGPISSVSFNVAALNTCSPMPNYRIRIKPTEQTALSTTFEVGEYTEVFQAAEYMPVQGWNVHGFSTPFVWDGASNLLIEVVTDLIAGSWAQNASVYYTNTGFNSGLYYRSDSSPAIDSQTGTAISSRSNMRFTMEPLDITDLNAMTIVGPTTPNVDSTVQYTVSVKNYSLTPVNTYTVKLMQEGEVELASVPGTVIEPSQTLEFTLPWTPSVLGETHLYGKVVMTGDENPANDETDMLTVTVMEAGLLVVELGNGTTTNTNTSASPYGTFYKNFRQQYLYTADEIYAAGGAPGLINSLAFNVQSIDQCTAMPNYRIRLKHTEQTALTTAFEAGEYTQVWQAAEYMPTNDWNLHVFSNPFFWDGASNLLVDIVTDIIPGSYARNALVYQTTTPFASSLRYQSDSTAADTATTGSVYSERSNARFFMIIDDMGSLSGTVTSGGAPLADATIAVEGTVFTANSAADGSYTLPFVPVGSQTVTASKHGYIDVSHTVTIVEDQTTTQDFVLNLLPQVAVSGRIVGSDNPTVGIEGATINLSGYEPYTATSDASGQFAIPNVFANHTYNYSVNVLGYASNSGTLEVGSASVNMGDIIVNELAFPPHSVVATEADDFSHVALEWQAPIPGGMGEWIHYDNGVNHDGIGTGNAADFDVAIRYPASALTEYAGMNLYSIKVWPKSAGQFSIRVWTGGTPTAPATMVVDQPFTASLDEWNTILLDEPVPINGNEELWFGYRANVTSGYPAGCDEGPVNDGFGNMIYFGGAWSTLTAITDPPLEYNWNIQGYVGYSAPDSDQLVSLSKTGKKLTALEDANRAMTLGQLRTESGKVSVSRSSIAVSQPKAMDRSLQGYKVYRLLADDQQNEANWVSLTPSVYGQTTFADNDWAPLASGVYKYAVKAAYTNDVMSPAAFSGEIHKGMMGTLEGMVTEFGTGLPVEDVQITAGEYSGTTNANGEFSFAVYAGTYTVTASKPGYQSFSQEGVTIIGLQTTPLDIVLTEIVLPPAAVLAEEAGSNVNLTWMAPGSGGGDFEDGFEEYTDFALEFGDWTLVDVDGSVTYSNGDVDYPNEQAAFAYTIFNPSTTTPPLTYATAHGGEKFAATMASMTPPNNDWLITPAFYGGGQISFWAMSIMDNYGLERFNVGVSTSGTDPADFTIISGANYIEAPIEWTEYSYDLSSYAGQEIYVGIQCVSNDAFMLMIDDVSVGASRNLDNLFATKISSQEALNDRAMEGYKVWRLLQGQESNEAQWTALTPTAITTTAHQDDDWSTLPDGMYRWAVKAIYTGGALSNSAFSNTIERMTQIGTISGFVRDEQNQAISGATVSSGDYSATTNANGAYSFMMPAGTHTVTASHPNYTAVSQEGIIVVTDQITTVNFVLPPSEIILSEGFETYEDFSLEFAPWTLVDVDGSNTYGITNTAWLNAYAPQAFIIFNPANTTPPVTSAEAHGGAKFAACFASTEPPNDDWIITPQINGGGEITFWAKSYVDTYGLERFKIGVSQTGTDPADFTYISEGTYVEVPAEWTEYTYSLADYEGLSIYVGINCVSNDAFFLLIDDVTITGPSSNPDGLTPALTTQLKGNYPNPFNPETTISYSVKDSGPVSIDIFNVKGQLVRKLVNDTKAAGNYTEIWNGKDNNGRAVSSGIYYFKMNAGKYSSTKKMILMK